MKHILFKTGVVALAACFASALCTHAEDKKNEEKKATLPAGMVAFAITYNDDDDWDKFEDQSARDWLKELSRCGFTTFGKPKDSKTQDKVWSDELFVVRFEHEKGFSSDEFDAYANALWELNKSIADKGELRVWEGKEQPVATDPKKTASENRENSYRWFYFYKGQKWLMEVYLRGEKKNTLQVNIEKKD